MLWGWWIWVMVQWAYPVAGDLARELDALAAETPWVDVNVAPVQELMALPLMTTDLAWAILHERQRAPFSDFEDFVRRVPLDPLQTYVYAQVLRFPQRQSATGLHGSAWIRMDATGRSTPALRVSGRWAWGQWTLRGPKPRGLLRLWYAGWEMALGSLHPRWGLDLLTDTRPGKRPHLYRGQRWRTGPTPWSWGLRGRWAHHSLWAWWTQGNAGIRWDPPFPGAINWTRRGVSIDAQVGASALRWAWELGWIDRQLQARTLLQVRTTGSRWKLGWTSSRSLILQGRVNLSPTAVVHLGAWSDSTTQGTRVRVQWKLQDLGLQVGFRSQQPQGDPHRIRWFLDLQNPEQGSRVHLEQVNRAGRHGWLVYGEKWWRNRRLTLRVRWAVYRVTSWHERLWLAEGAPGLWPRVFTLTTPGYRGTLAWAWQLGDTLRLFGWVSLGEDLRRHTWKPEACVALRW